MRGTLLHAVDEALHEGLIPTYAGNTACGDGFEFFLWAHPHVCGEHGASYMLGLRSWGSSPRMRGTPNTDNFMDGFAGLIPTYAGNTRV